MPRSKNHQLGTTVAIVGAVLGAVAFAGLVIFAVENEYWAQSPSPPQKSPDKEAHAILSRYGLGYASLSDGVRYVDKYELIMLNSQYKPDLQGTRGITGSLLTEKGSVMPFVILINETSFGGKKKTQVVKVKVNGWTVDPPR